MSQSKKHFQSMPVDRSESLEGASVGDPEVVAFPQQLLERSPLDELIRMLVNNLPNNQNLPGCLMDR